MSILYLLLLPLFIFTLYKKVSMVIVSAREGNHSKLKADVFFLVLVIVVATGLVLVIEFM